MKILMIEDDSPTVEAINLTLAIYEPGFTLRSTARGLEGLELVRDEHFDAVILDLGLPDIDGLEVLQKLRSFSNIPVLIISARHNPDIVESTRKLGAGEYIFKPFDSMKFLNGLRKTASVLK
jgi:DNA-binding response OmpR family regulator